MAVVDATWTAPARAEVRTMEPRVGPLLIAAALVAGLALVLASTPIVARGDYGQWLMASRYYLGESVPGYRSIPALPPFVPIALAAIQLVARDPVMALQVMNIVLMVGLAMSLFSAGAALGRSAVVGLLSVAIGFLVTDRYLELFAFGGLLQSAAVMFTAFAVAAFTRAGWGPRIERRWWIAGTAALAGAALSHVGAGTVAVPTGLAVAGISAFRLRGLGWAALRQALVPVLLGMGIIALYWALILLPAGHEYVSNPASLAYRGPDRLASTLFDFWPTAMVIVVGLATVVIGTIAELLQRTVDRFVTLMAWTGVAWGSLFVAVVTGASTDYPRFSPVLLAPLVVACALATWWLMRTAAVYLSSLAPAIRTSAWVMLIASVTVLLATPFAVDRYLRQVQVYQPRDAAALTAAVSWLDETLPDDTVATLTAVRDGKWLEGLTGREALFSLPVRYAFRPVEWQRSVDADTLLRTTAALTSQAFFVKFTSEVGGADAPVPTGILLGVNHGGEFVELLRQGPRDTSLVATDGSAVVAALQATGVETGRTQSAAWIRTDWAGTVGSVPTTLTRTVQVVDGAATLELTDATSGPGLETAFYPPVGMALTELAVDGHEARACFVRIGASEPCLQIRASASDAVVEPTADGGFRIRTASPLLQVRITALTASGAAVGLNVLDPSAIVAAHRVGAALLLATDPAFVFRRARLEALGFEVAHTEGPYAVMVRSDLLDGGSP
jgi:hypothetical protein